VPSEYDSLLAKVIAWGSDREEAIGRMRRALEEMRVAGIPTSLPFHRAALFDQEFITGRYDTEFVARWAARKTADLSDGTAAAAEIGRGRQWSIVLEGGSHEITVVTHDPLRLDVDGRDVHATVSDERALRAGRGAVGTRTGRVELRAPMPGLLKTVHVNEGDTVERDAPIVTLEAMKMENELVAPIRGRVTKLNHRSGTKVEGGAVLAILVAE